MGLTRLAPSPTGALHLGNARTFLINWLDARIHHRKVILRIEDIDSPRIKSGSHTQTLADLRWLGLDWDFGPVFQSQNLPRYRIAVDMLLASHAAYPCVCSRSEVDSAASAPHASDGATVYPGTCRNRFPSPAAALVATGRHPTLRFRLPSTHFTFVDDFRGKVTIPTDTLGDFPVLKADGTPAYQLACAIDDADSGVTHVVRGDDLLDSVPRQALLLHALGLAGRVPRYTHVPLVLGPDGRRLAKRHGDTRLATHRAHHSSPDRVLSLLARWSGITQPIPTPRSAADLLPHFNLDRVPRTPITMTPDDEQFLRGT